MTRHLLPFSNCKRCIAVGLLLRFASVGTAEPLPVRVFFEPPALDLPRVSPDGRQLTVAAVLNGQQTVSVLDLTTGQPKPIGRLGASVLTNLWWKGDDWLLLEVRDARGQIAYRTVDVRSAKMNTLSTLNNRGSRFGALLPDDPEHVLMLTEVGAATELGRLNVRTGAARAIESVAGEVYRVAAGKSGVIAVQVAQGGKHALLWRSEPAARFAKREVPADARIELILQSAHPDQRRLYVVDYSPAHTARITLLDAHSGKQEEVFASPDVDPDGLKFLSPWLDSAPAAALYETDRPRLHFLDDRAAQLHAQVDEALAGSVNDIVSISADGQVAVVHSHSERSPGTFFVLNRTAGKLMPIGARYAGVDPARTGETRPITCIARDGLPIRGRVILPAGATMPPAIVVADHAGGGERSRYRFEAFGQLLATRGYAVAYVDYRGTSGFGRAFLERGDQQIAEGMATDLQDATKWLADQRLVDPARVIIAGIGEGGLPAVHALANSDLFCGWINWSTPMDLAPITRRDSLLAAKADGNAFTNTQRWWQQKAYREKISPIEVLPRIKVPAFHLEYHDAIARHYKRHAIPHVFAEHRDADTKSETIERNVAGYQQLFDFLAKYFPVRRP